MNWIKSNNNYVLKGDDFYISFLSNEASYLLWGYAWANDGDQDETAICHDGKFYILNGDYRKEYEELFPQGYDACYTFYLNNQDKKSSWSN